MIGCSVNLNSRISKAFNLSFRNLNSTLFWSKSYEGFAMIENPSTNFMKCQAIPNKFCTPLIFLGTRKLITTAIPRADSLMSSSLISYPKYSVLVNSNLYFSNQSSILLATNYINHFFSTKQLCSIVEVAINMSSMYVTTSPE